MSAIRLPFFPAPRDKKVGFLHDDCLQPRAEQPKDVAKAARRLPALKTIRRATKLPQFGRPRDKNVTGGVHVLSRRKNTTYASNLV